MHVGKLLQIRDQGSKENLFLNKNKNIFNRYMEDK